MKKEIFKTKLKKVLEWILDDSGELDLRKAPIWLFGGVIGLFSVYFLLSVSLGSFGDSATTGPFGDSFGPLTSLFSGLAFSGLIYTVLLQRQELKLQRCELQDGRKEFVYNRHIDLVYRETVDLNGLGCSIDYQFDEESYSLLEALSIIDSRDDVLFKGFVRNNELNLCRFYKKMWISLSQVRAVVNQDICSNTLETNDLEKIEHLFVVRNRIYSDYAKEIHLLEKNGFTFDTELSIYTNAIATRMEELNVVFEKPPGFNLSMKDT